jgi:ribosomal protein S18 acetylase RimI-like enzyme
VERDEGSARSAGPDFRARVCVEDAQILLGLAREFHREDGHPLDRAGEEAVGLIAVGDPFARAWLAREQGEVVGYLVITLGFSIEYGGRDGFIDDFFVAPKARGRGLGKTMLDFALAQAKQLGIRTLHLEVEPGNDPALELYRSAGFEETGRRLMRCRLSDR